jgi:UDP-N-acetylglucosamine 2-epimerase (non-hydrolysing)
MKMKIHLIAAARPNFMKIAPLYHAALKSESWAEPVIVHTGQHYDLNMSDVFFQDLGLPEPDIHLGVGSGTHAAQTGRVMMAYEKVLFERKPDLVVVVGDVNSTVACTLAAAKINNYNGQLTTTNGHDRRPCVGHLEAGLRSFDRTMPEEINRLVTDALADILWTPSEDGDENLIREGVSGEKIQRVGNIMIDSLEMLRDKIQSQDTCIMIDSLEMLRDKIQSQDTCSDFGLKPQKYGMVTLHRPSNVDAPKKLGKLFDLLSRISKKIPLVFPIHPRTRKSAEQIGILPQLDQSKEVILLDPLNYVSFMNLVFNCRFALTDSGGIQEETTYLGIPCITLRPNTERPLTLTRGTNRLCELDNLAAVVDSVLSEKKRQTCKIELWDGHTAERVVDSIKDFF